MTIRRERKPDRRPQILFWLLILALIGIVALAVVWRMNVYALDMTLRGEENIVLEYGSVFEDPGAEATFSGSILLRDEQEIPVKMEGTVDTAVVGDYQITYRAQITYRDLFWERTETKELTRTIHVVDRQPPEITLTHQDGHFTLPGQEYVEEGFTATDGYDGDLTGQVVRSVKGNTVEYSVTDSSGNVTTVTRQIVYDDPVAPELTLNGEKTMTLTAGDDFTDPGCNAYDNCDGNLDAAITVSGAVDTETPGTYTLTYTVTDSYGNVASLKRTVVVEEYIPPETEPPATEPTTPPETEPLPEIPEVQQPSNGKVIYLTFDDGPGPYTAQLLDILDKYDVKVTFFIIGTDYLSLLPRMTEAGHTVAMHTYSHVYSTVYASDDAFFSDLTRIQDKIYEYTGQTANILRFPGGSSNTISRNYSKGIMTRLTAAVEEQGYRYFDWNVDSNDAGGAKTSDEVYRNVVNGIKNSGRKSFVVLQHDIKKFSVEAVERIIQWGLANGYTFEALTLDSPECEHGLNN